MRKARFFKAPDHEARALFARSSTVHLAGQGDAGPIGRTVHGVVCDGALYFHAAAVGEKQGLVGREVVIWSDETVATVPSYFLDPVLACPATTLYRSAMVRGTLEAVDDLGEKARALMALMARLQPEGGYAPITADDPRYHKAVASIGVLKVSLDAAVAKHKLAQNRTPDERARLVASLWARGAPGDDAAIEAIRGANAAVTVPAVLASGEGYSLHARLPSTVLDGAVALLRDAYWHTASTPEGIAAMHREAAAWVGACDAEGRLIASARVVSDRVRNAWLYDVVVAEAWRGRGLGRRVVALALDHGAVRGVERVSLGTRDAHGLYEKFGFVRAVDTPLANRLMTRIQRSEPLSASARRPGA